MRGQTFNCQNSLTDQKKTSGSDVPLSLSAYALILRFSDINIYLLTYLHLFDIKAGLINGQLYS